MNETILASGNYFPKSTETTKLYIYHRVLNI